MTNLLRHAYALDGARAGQPLSETEAIAALRADDLARVHLPATDPATRGWIETNLSYLDSHATEALVAEETRPRATFIEDGVLLVLRGINPGAEADPEDMVSVRIWADPHRIVTLSRQPMPVLGELVASFSGPDRPETAGAFLAALADLLNDQIEDFAADLSEAVADIEAGVIDTPDPDQRHMVMTRRLAAITLRRHIAPQREALEALMRSTGPLLSADDRRHLLEVHDRLTRMVETLDAMREQLSVLREELAGQLSDRINRNMYLLSILSAVFLPLGFLTGLFGINIGGMPGTDDPRAFLLFSGAMLAVALAVLGFLRWKRWF